MKYHLRLLMLDTNRVLEDIEKKKVIMLVNLEKDVKIEEYNDSVNAN